MKPSHIVGIGASAGGLQAIRSFFDTAPSDANITFVVIQHLSPDFKSLMDQLLAKITQMRVRVVEENMPVEANTVYLIPPKKNITINKQCFRLEEQRREHTVNLPIDIFLKSIASNYTDKAIAIILSGTGSDGSKGCVEIARRGGLTIVQSPEQAQFDGMPRNAIATKAIQYVLSIDEIPKAITKFIKYPEQFEEYVNQNVAVKASEYTQLLNIIMRVYQIDFGNYKLTTITRRIDRRIKLCGLNSLEALIACVENDTAMLEKVKNDLLIGVSEFFRDTEAFKLLDKEVIQKLVLAFEKKKEALRIWVPACSTGEEVYSIAIMLLEAAEERNIKLQVKLFATDINQEYLEKASCGHYSAEDVENIPHDLLSKYFIKRSNGVFVIDKAIRNYVAFSQHNIISDPPFTKLDCVSCRNFLIYIQPEVQLKILNSLSYSLCVDGYLFLGSSETFHYSGDFECINESWKLYKKIKVSRFPLPSSRINESHSITPTTHKFIATNIKRKTKQDYSARDDIDTYTFQATLNKLVPCGFIINNDKSLRRIIGEGSEFVDLTRDQIQHVDLSKALLDGFQVPFDTAYYKAMTEKSDFSCTNIMHINRGRTYALHVKPILDNKKTILCFLVIIEIENQHKAKNDINYLSLSNNSEVIIEQQKIELQETKESLQLTIEELEATNEELQSTNEELLASNEELQSTNEELHSVNEELYTVNAEYQSKIEELMRASDDINNILRSTNIGAIFVDKRLAIRFFTPSIAPIYNLMDSDIGRSIRNFTHILKYDQVINDIEQVLTSKIVSKAEVIDQNGKWYSLKILPYLLSNKQVDGAIITLVDISESKFANEKLRQSDERLSMTLESGSIGLWQYYTDTGCVEIDTTLAKLLSKKENKEVKNYQQFIESIHPEDVKNVELAFDVSLAEHSDLNIEFRIIKPNKMVAWIAARAKVHCNEALQPPMFSGIC